ncbi:YHS domain-containing (seleno)protein [Marinomonas sp. 2405UD68-3]|uniref:YHS domain-containing (seleno)protein n=1 Tax=Marinomonas sp. 2405UD68-3 TaxID=3391835 RepID=UPI0039C9199F
MEYRSNHSVSRSKPIKLTTLISAAFISVFFGISTLFAQPVSTGFWGNTAIGGHDATAYYKTNNIGRTPTEKGQSLYTVLWKGAEWHFASQASADKFLASPEAYVPKYNGHCANALSLGEGLISTNGKVWEFFGDELHLFFAERGRQRWLKGDWKSFQKEANLAWSQEINSAIN